MKAFLQSPVGIIEIEETEGYISSVRIVEESAVAESGSNEVLDKAVMQLQEYFSGVRKHFDLPVKQQGTDFQQKAWEYLSTIPYGQTVSYKTQATALGSPNSCRAVGSANGKNHLAIIVPCHRVVSHGKGMGGYAYGLKVKEYLLNLEMNSL